MRNLRQSYFEQVVQNMIDANPVVSLTETDNFCMLLTQYFS